MRALKEGSVTGRLAVNNGTEWHLMIFQVLEMLNLAHMSVFAKSEIKRKYHHSCLDCVFEIFRSRYRFMNRIMIIEFQRAEDSMSQVISESLSCWDLAAMYCG